MESWVVLLGIASFLLLLYVVSEYLARKGLMYRNPRNSVTSSAGAALMELNAIAKPKTSHMIEPIQTRPLLREEEDAGDDGKYVVRLPNQSAARQV